MALVKTESLVGLAAAIATAVPALAGKITVQQQISATIETYPNLAIIVPSNLPFDPAQALMQADLGGGTVVYNVGAFEGPCQMRLTTTTLRERSVIEGALLDYFLSRELSPGVIVVPVVSSTPLLSWVASFELDGDQWQDTRALEREYESVITLNAVLPALTTRTNVLQIDTLKIGLTESFSITFDPSFNPRTAVGVVQINQDGTITPA